MKRLKLISDNNSGETMRSLFIWSLLAVLCPLSVGNMPQEERDGLAWKISDLMKRLGISNEKVSHLRADVTSLEKDIYQCEKKLKIGANDNTDINREIDELNEKNSACEQVTTSLQKQLGDIEETKRVKMNTISVEIEDSRQKLEICQGKTLPASDCDCYECEANAEAWKTSKVKTMDKFQKCKLIKQTHKTLKYFLSKELVRLEGPLVRVKEDLAAVDENLTSQGKILVKYTLELDGLKKDHRTLVRVHASLQEISTESEKDFDLCTIEKSQAVFMYEGTQLAIEDQKQRVEEINIQRKELEANRQVVIEDDQRYKRYLLVCILTIFAASTSQISVWLTDAWTRRQQQIKDEKAQLKREKRQARDSRGRKQKVH